MAGVFNSDRYLPGHRSLDGMGGDNGMGYMNKSVLFDSRLKKSGSQYREAKTGRFLSRREAKEQLKPQGAECMGCSIMVGEGYMETQLHQVGDYKICGWCYDQLNKRGHLWVQPYNNYMWLYPDGQVAVRKSVIGGDEEE